MIAQKRKTRTVIIISSAAAALAVIITAAFFAMRAMRLENALKKLDANDETSVIRVMKYGGRDLSVVTRVANAYIGNSDYGSAAGFLLYCVQYLKGGEEQLSMLRDCCAHLGTEDAFLESLDNISPAGEFEPVSVYDGKSYGFSDGVYVSFCAGYAKAKISPILPLGIAACRSGVYVLDSSDRLLKFLSYTGIELNVINDARMNEFIYCGDRIYYIDESGIPYGTAKTELAAGEFAANLHEENGRAVCTVYDINYNELRNITLD